MKYVVSSIKKFSVYIGVLSLLIIISLASSQFLVTTSAQAGVKVVKIGWGGTSFDTFNPFTTYAQISGWIGSDVYDTLVRFDKSYKNFIPDLAESWEMNSTVVVFHLVKNATFHDGVPVTAYDVEYSFKLASQDWSRLAPNVEGVEEIKILDNYTIMFKTKSSIIFMLMAATSVPIVPKHVWEKVKDPSTYPDYPPIGSGPFKVTDYKEGQYVVLEKNPNYFRTAWIPKVDKIIISFYSDVTAASNALRAGDIDAVGPYVPVSVAEELKNDPRFVVITSPPVLYFYLAFNVYPEGKGNPTLRDLNVRLALAHAVNLTYLAELAWHGYAQPLATVMPYTNIFYDPNIKPYTFNLTLANEILDKAGYKRGPDGVRVSPNGTPLKYKLLVPSNMPEAVRAAQQIAQWWSQIGVSVDVEAMDTGSMASIIWTKVDNKTTLGHDMDIWDWFVSPGDPTILSVFLSNQVILGTSDSGYVNPEYDALYQKLLEAPDLDTVRDLAWKMQEMLHRDLPYLPLYQVTAPQAFNKRITGFDLDWPGGPFGGYDWTVFLKVNLAQYVSPTTTTPPTFTATTSPVQVTTLTTTSLPILTSAAPTTATQTSAPSPVSASTEAMIALIIMVIVIIAAIITLLIRRGRK